MKNTQNPPYPGDGFSAKALWIAIGKLHEWATAMREEYSGQDSGVGVIIPNLRDLPTEARHYLTQALVIQWGHLILMRRIREHWDHIQRLFEKDPEHPSCLRQRLLTVQSAVNMLNECCVSYERREADAFRRHDQLQTSIENVETQIFEQLTPEVPGVPSANVD